MLQPLPLDILMFLLPLALGAIAFGVGRSAYRLSKRARAGTLAAVFGILTIGGIAIQCQLVELGALLSWLGGITVLLAWLALLLLGIVWSAPGRSLSGGFIATLAVLACCLLVIESSGRLWWRWVDPESWQRVAAADGRLRQSSGLTCSPAAAVMLLHHYGIRASEGEMAYLAGTSLFGTDAYSMARALERKTPSGWRVSTEATDYDACLRRPEPFLAHVNGPFAGHALLVEAIAPDHVVVLDPADGERRTMSRADFEKIWDGTAIHLVLQAE